MILLLDPVWSRIRSDLNHRFQHFRQLRNVMRWVEHLEPSGGYTKQEQAYIQNHILPPLVHEKKNEALKAFKYFESLVQERLYNEKKRNTDLQDSRR